MPQALATPYLGPGYTDEETEEYLKEKGAAYTREANLPKKLAELLAANKVLALAHGRMEYGPRALGNRTMMYAAKDPKVNDWLNRRLNRSEFMPFAPVTLREHRSDLPPGSYWKSCRGCQQSGRDLACECLDTAGNWLRANSEDDCPRGYANLNGSLRCEGAA